MAAREGEDPLAGLQRSRQPGPTGATPDCSLDAPANTQIKGDMCTDYEQPILWAETCKMMQAPQLRIPTSS
jgi:hypothetical protein